MGERIRNFRARLTGGAPLIGTFVKTPSPIICEVLTHAQLDVVCVDAEHAPFGRLEVDGCIAVFRAADQPSLVRLSTSSASDICNALDSGATGFLVPHVSSAGQARTVAQAARFGAGGRGFSASTRAAGFGARSIRDHVADSDNQTTVIVQIEDPSALDSVAAIAAVEGIDGIFIGRIDLAIAMGKDPLASEVADAVAAICAAGRKAGIAVGMFTPKFAEVARWRTAGASFFLLDSEQGFVLSGARQLAAAFREDNSR